MMQKLRASFLQVVSDDRGQDLIEYALLTGIVTAGLIAVLPALQAKISAAFTSWGNQSNDLWTPPAST
jgi:Flp pilus assembly pilin Flp